MEQTKLHDAAVSAMEQLLSLVQLNEDSIDTSAALDNNNNNNATRSTSTAYYTIRNEDMWMLKSLLIPIDQYLYSLEIGHTASTATAPKSIRDVLLLLITSTSSSSSSATASKQKWEQFISVVTMGMEQQQQQHQRPSQTMNSWHKNTDDEHDICDNDDTDGYNSHEITASGTATIAAIDNIQEVELTPIAVASALIYTQLLQYRNAYTMPGMVEVLPILSLTSVIQRWKQYCCTIFSSSNSSTRGKKKRLVVASRKKRTNGNSQEEIISEDIDIVVDDDDDDDDDAYPIKRRNRNRGTKIYTTTSNDEDNDEEDDNMEDTDNSSNDFMCPTNLIQYGIRMGQALCHISLQHPSGCTNEFSMHWNIEIIESILHCIITIITTLQSIVTSTTNNKHSELDNTMYDLEKQKENVQQLIELAIQALTQAILISNDTTVVDALDDDNENIRFLTESDDDDDNEDSDSDVEEKKNHKAKSSKPQQRLQNLSRRHEIMVATLRGLYPYIAMQKDSTLMIGGESGKQRIVKLVSSILQRIIQNIATDIQLHPYRWPKQLYATQETNLKLNNPGSPSPLLVVDDSSNENNNPMVTPIASRKLIRPAVTLSSSTTLTPIGQMRNNLPRQSLTPKRKNQTPAAKTPMTTHTVSSSNTGIKGQEEQQQQSYRPIPVLSALIGILQQMATLSSGLETASNRSIMIESIYTCIQQLPIHDCNYYIQFLIKLCHSKISIHRLVASEFIGHILSNDWIWTLQNPGMNNNEIKDWDRLATSFGVLSPYTPHRKKTNELAIKTMHGTALAYTLFGAMKGRLLDRIPTIRCISANATASICRRLASSLPHDSNETNVTAAGATRNGIHHVLSDHVDDLIETLRERIVSDDKATVRKATCTALVDTLMIGMMHRENYENNSTAIDCMITETDVIVLNAACQDPSPAVRRAAAEGLTSLIETFNSNATSYSNASIRSILNSLEMIWSNSVLPMVLDTETSCVNKAQELVERLIIIPLVCDELDNENYSDDCNNISRGKNTSWRILFRLGNGTSNGSSKRSEMEALSAVIQKCMIAALGKSNYHYTCESIFRMIYATATNSLDTDVADVFSSENDAQRSGVWFFFNATIGENAISRDVLRILKKSKIDMNFLCSSWEKLLSLFLSQDTLMRNKPALQSSICYCLHVLSQLAQLVDCEMAMHTADKLQNLLGSFSLPPELIGSSIKALVATTIAAHKSETQAVQYEHCTTWIRSLYNNCETSLSSFDYDREETARISRIIFTVGEVSMIGFSASDDSSDKSLTKQSDVNTAESSVLGRGICERPSKQLVEFVQAFMTDTYPMTTSSDEKSIPVSIRAHAFVAVGKLCLRDNTLAKQSLNILARELHNSIENRNWAVQSNALLVLGDLCIKYTNMVDRFLPVMAGCLQAGTMNTSDVVEVFGSSNNGPSLVRKHAILLLSNLLLQDYIKWRGLLFHRFLVATVDDDEEVAVLAETVLFGPLLSKQPKLFTNQFVESIFVLNRCTDHTIFKAAAALGDGGSGISVGFDGIDLNSERGREKRLLMYRMLLSKMSDEDKIGVTARISKEILGGALKHGSELNHVARNTSTDNNTSVNSNSPAFHVLSDALAILKSPEIRVGNSRSNSTDDDDDMIVDPNISTSSNNVKQRELVLAKGRLLSNVSRKHLIEILIPILCQLKNVLEQSHSLLLNDVMLYLQDIYVRYKKDVREVLMNDTTTLQEIEYDISKLQQQQRKLQQQQRNKSISSRRSSASTSTTN